MTGSGRWSLAGHPPPLVVPAGERPHLVDVPTRPPLGIAGPRVPDLQFTIHEGDALLFYTDGLVERRGESLDRGLDRLVTTASGTVADAAELADRVVDAMCGDLSDDCCLLVVHRKKRANPAESSTGGVPSDQAL